MKMKQLLTTLLLTASLQLMAQNWSGNPILMGFHADPEVMYSNLTGRYYIYSTTDGVAGWGGSYFTCFSSADLTNWRYEGMNLNLPRDTRWASGNAWAPAIEEKLVDGQYLTTSISVVRPDTAKPSAWQWPIGRKVRSKT